MRSSLGPLVALIAALAIFFAYINPAWGGSIADQKAAIAAEDQALAASATYTKKENELAQERDQISPEDLARLSTFLPDSVNNVQIILDLNNLASRSGVLLSHADVATANSPAAGGAAAGLPTSGEGPVGSVDLSLSAIGTYQAFRSFLAGIEMSARVLDVESLTVKGSDTGVYNYEMTIRLYWLR